MESFLSGREEWMGRGRSLYQEYSWWGKCWLLTCLGETDRGRVCERWPGRPPGFTPGGFFPGGGTGGSVDEGRGPGACPQCGRLGTYPPDQRGCASTAPQSGRSRGEGRGQAQGPLPSTLRPLVPTPWEATPIIICASCTTMIQFCH